MVFLTQLVNQNILYGKMTHIPTPVKVMAVFNTQLLLRNTLRSLEIDRKISVMIYKLTTNPRKGY